MLHVKADSPFLTPDVGFSQREVLPRIRHIFYTYGAASNVSITYEGFDPVYEREEVG